MFYLIDPYMIRLHNLEREEKMREAQQYAMLKQAGFTPSPMTWKRLKEGVQNYLSRLSLFEKPANPCLDCPPAG